MDKGSVLVMAKQNKDDLPEGSYIPRDVSWMYFNHRILKEAEKENLPVYDRLNFLGIYSSNLDEFYKVRVASLQRVAESKAGGIKDEKKEAKEELEQIAALTKEYDQEYIECQNQVFDTLKSAGINLIDEKQLDDEQSRFVHEYFMRKVAGYINPIIITRKANLSDVNDTHIYLAVKMSGNKKNPAYAILALPVARCGRFVRLPDRDGKAYVIYLDDIVRIHLPYIFNEMGYSKYEAYALKFSKDAEMEVESDPEEGLLRTLSQAVKDRKKGLPVRVIFGEGIPDDLKEILSKSLKVDKLDLVSVGGKYHNNKDLGKFPYISLKKGKSLKSPDWMTVEIPEVDAGISLIDRIRAKDMLVHVPYESFDAFIRFLQECALSPRVTEIKATIYRAAQNSQVVKALSTASQNGKKVTCMVELMARFDESSNILISQALRDAGCEVLPSTEGFKVHGKIVYVKVKDGPDIAVVSTGNFHEGNARAYTDCLLFTADKRIVSEVNQIFDYIAAPYKKQVFRHLLVSPNHMQSVFQRLIRNEETNAEKGLPSGIKIKINHITDKAMVKLLYEAASKGVKTDLLIRGNSSLVTTLPQLKGNLTVHAIIDHYLEHSRIFIFKNAGHPLVFMGSADWMPRNLYNRIEVIAPVYDEDIQKELTEIVDFGLKDNCQASIATGDGIYHPVPVKKGEPIFRSQIELSKAAAERKDRASSALFALMRKKEDND